MDAIDLLAVISDWKPLQPLAHGTLFSYNGEVLRVVPMNKNDLSCTNCHFYSTAGVLCRPSELPDCLSRKFVEVSL